VLGLSSPSVLLQGGMGQARVTRVVGSRLKLSCNLYSFNKPLVSSAMTLEEVFEFCARAGFDAVDPTGYYFPGYPKLPPDDYLYRIKRLAFVLGLDISGTGCRNDFTDADPSKRAADIELVKSWIGCAARLGAPNLRVFAGKGVPEGHVEEEVSDWIADALVECAEHGRKHGVMISLQNHYDFLKRPDQILRILKKVDSEWLGLNLDIGSFRDADAYEDVARVAPYAITWQIKELVYVGGKETKTDISRIVRIARESGYRGYFPIETLGDGDPRVSVPAFLAEVRKALA
jgi:sugar phosphate isomerase/epimerase